MDPKLVASEPYVKWSDAAGMRDWFAHHYFDTSRAVVEATITEDLPSLEEGVLQLQAHLELSKQRDHYGPSRGRNDDRGLGR